MRQRIGITQFVMWSLFEWAADDFDCCFPTPSLHWTALSASYGLAWAAPGRVASEGTMDSKSTAIIRNTMVRS